MSDLYHSGNRRLQDQFDTRRLADRLEEVKVHDAFTPDDKAFIERMDMFFLATAVTDGEDQPHKKPWERHAAAKIKFQLDDIRPDGLRGPADGLVSVSYEFCVRADDRFYQEVRRIDPSVQIHPNSSGRIACPKGQVLCIGQTNQPHWRDVLRRLSSLSYISEIRECFFE